MIPGIEHCPTLEELQAETKAIFDKEVDEHGERAEELVRRLAEKGIEGSFNGRASYNTFGVQRVGIQLVQRAVSSRGWIMELNDGGLVRQGKEFGTLKELLDFVENVYFPKKDWEIFDTVYDERLQTIYQLADERDQRVTIETRPEAGRMKAVVFVIKRHTDNVLHHGTFAKFSEAVASLETFFNT